MNGSQRVRERRLVEKINFELDSIVSPKIP